MGSSREETPDAGRRLRTEGPLKRIVTTASSQRAPRDRASGPRGQDGNGWHLLTIVEVAQQCGLSEKAVRRAIEDGELRASKLRSRLRIRPEDVDAWISEASSPRRVSPPARNAKARRSVGQFRALVLSEEQADGQG